MICGQSKIVRQLTSSLLYESNKNGNKICREASIGSLRIAHLGNSATFSMIARIGLNGLILTL